MSRSDYYGGFIDVFAKRRISGWAVSVTQLNRPVYVFLKTSHRIIKIRPTEYRGDVFAAHGAGAMSGFIFDLDACSLPMGVIPDEYIIGAYFQDGKIVSGQPEDISENIDIGEIKYYLHIQKTAGTSLRGAVAQDLTPWQVMYIYPEPPGVIGAYADFSLEQIANLRLVFGHYYFGLHSQQPFSAKYYTLLRDPVARLRSQVQHIARSNRTSPTEVLAQHLGECCYEELDNYYVRVISENDTSTLPLRVQSESALQEAYDNVENYFGAISTMEDEDIVDWFARHLGLTIPELPRSNVTEDQDRSFVDTMNFATLLRMNCLDMDFYTWIRRKNGK